jgi:hypothetical protein
MIEDLKSGVQDLQSSVSDRPYRCRITSDAEIAAAGI